MAKRRGRHTSELRLAVDADGVQRLLTEAGFEARPRMHNDGSAVPDGVYFERYGDAFVVWVPPDPQRTVGNASVPTTAHLECTPDRDGVRVLIRRSRGIARTLVAVGVPVLIVTLVILVSMGAPLSAAWLLCFPALLTWIVIAHQRSIGRGRDELALRRVGEALGPLALPAEGGHHGPYRST